MKNNEEAHNCLLRQASEGREYDLSWRRTCQDLEMLKAGAVDTMCSMLE